MDVERTPLALCRPGPWYLCLPNRQHLTISGRGFTDLWLFHGLHQAKQVQQMAEAHSGVTLVPRSGKGPNALDFHLSFYLGYVAAKHPDAHLVVVANDKGYDPMIARARLLNFTVRRVGHKAKVAVAVKTPVAKQAPAPGKKATAKKAPVTKVAASTPVPAKKAVPAKPKAPAQPKVAEAPLTTETKTFARVKKAVLKMGAERPTKTRSFLRHIGAILGKGSTAEQIDAVVAKLANAGVLRVDGASVVYSSTSAQ